MDTTLDGLLDRRVTIEQPKDGFRVAVDTVLLAATVPACTGEHVADFGCGVGGAMLCLATRVPDIVLTGIEMQRDLANLARANIVRNKMGADVREADVTCLKDEAAFDHIMMNPPYHDEVKHDVSAHAGKRAANTEKDGDLALWIAAAARALKSSGALMLIHRADRREEIMAYLAKSFGRIEILPVLPKAGAPPKRILIRAYKLGQGDTIECRALVLHKNTGGYTDAAEAILRHMKAVAFTAI
jgi:tRNA1(Val) A37 N6-methylase TrmN6